MKREGRGGRREGRGERGEGRGEGRGKGVEWENAENAQCGNSKHPFPFPHAMLCRWLHNAGPLCYGATGGFDRVHMYVPMIEHLE